MMRDEELKKPVTLEVLLDYTDSFLLPKLSDIISDQIHDEFGNIISTKIQGEIRPLIQEEVRPVISEHEYKIKSYIEDKLADYHSDIFKRLDRKETTEREFKMKIVELLKKHNIGTGEDIAFLEGVVRGS